MREIELLPPSRFTSRIKELGMQKESAPQQLLDSAGRLIKNIAPRATKALSAASGAGRVSSNLVKPVASGVGRVSSNVVARPVASVVNKASAPIVEAVGKSPGFLRRHLMAILGLGAAGTVAGGSAVGAGTLGWSGATQMGKDRREREDLMSRIREQLNAVAPSATGPVAREKALKEMQDAFIFDPGSGTYRSVNGSTMIGNSAYNRRLGALTRKYSGTTPQGYGSRVKTWDNNRRSEIDRLMQRFEKLRSPSVLRPAFYSGVGNEFKQNLNTISNPIRGMFR